MIDLARGVTAREVVPGRPEGVELLAARLAAYADGAAEAVSRLRAIAAGSWVGEAADAFREAVGGLPAKLERGVGAFQEAAFELHFYASTLRESQAVANRAIELFEEAKLFLLVDDHSRLLVHG